MKEELDEEEKDFRTRKVLGLSATQWESLEEDRRAIFYQKELWHEENRLAYLEEKEEKERLFKATNSRYKQQKYVLFVEMNQLISQHYSDVLFFFRRMAKKEKIPENWND